MTSRSVRGDALAGAGAGALLLLSAAAWAQSGEQLGGKSAQEVELRATGQGTYAPEAQAAEAVVPPALVTPSPAAYPEALKAAPVAGEVQLELLVDEGGRVAEVAVAQGGGHPALDAAATDAARRLVFTPATQGGKPVAVRLRYTYAFQVPEAPKGALRGEVRARGTRAPVVGATLLVDGREAGESGEGGRFALELPAGAHRVEVRAQGHLAAAFDEAVKAGEALEVVYRLQPHTQSPYETVVRGARERTEVARVSLQEQELREVPGTQGDPFRVIMLMPGVSSLASGVSYPVVRGNQPAATGYFLDGVRIPGLFHLALGPAVVHPDFIDRIDFYAGVPPTQYGRQLGGIVEGYASRPRDDRLHASAYADLINAGAFVETPVKQTGTHVTLSGRFSYTPWLGARVAEAFIQADPSGYKERPIADFYDYQARVEQPVGAAGKLRLLVFGASDLVGEDSNDPEHGVDGVAFTRFHRADLRYAHATRLGDVEAGVTWGTEAVGFRADSGDGEHEVEEGHYEVNARTWAARARWTHRVLPRLTLAAGADLEHRRSATLFESRFAAALQGAEASAFFKPRTLGTSAGAWAEATWQPTDVLSVTGGLRADSFHLAGGVQHGSLDPRLSARWALTEALTLKGGVGAVHQAPTVLITLPVLDAAGLRYGLQEAYGGDVGAEWALAPGLELVADAYYTHHARSLELDLGQVLEEYRRRAGLGRDRATWGRSYGLELMLRHPLGGGWFGWVSYALQRSERNTRYALMDADYEVTGFAEGLLPFAFDQTHVFNAAASWQLPRDWTLGFVAHVNSGRPESGQISSRTAGPWYDPVTGAGEWRSVSRDRIARLPPFVRVDVRAAKKWTFDDFTLEAYLDVLNASVQSEVLAYEYGYDYDRAPPSADFSQLPLRRKPIGLPIVVPMLGLKGVY